MSIQSIIACLGNAQLRVGNVRRHDSGRESRDRRRVRSLRMNVDYREWPPCAALNGVVLAYWRVAGDGTSVPSPTILPDAYVEIVINLGGVVILEGPAITGSQPARAVVGLLDKAIEMRYPTDVCTFGIRLHPARAAAF